MKAKLNELCEVFTVAMIVLAALAVFLTVVCGTIYYGGCKVRDVITEHREVVR